MSILSGLNLSIADATEVAQGGKVSKRAARAAIMQSVNLTAVKVVHNAECIIVDGSNAGKIRQSGEGFVSQTFGQTEVEVAFLPRVEDKLLNVGGQAQAFKVCYLTVTMTARKGLNANLMAAAAKAFYVEDVGSVYAAMFRLLGHKVDESNPAGADLSASNADAAAFCEPFAQALSPYVAPAQQPAAVPAGRPTLSAASLADEDDSAPAAVVAQQRRNK